MLGWSIYIYRQADGETAPATKDSKRGELLAKWEAQWDGLSWMEELVKAGKATSLGGNGYPCLYTALTECLLPYVEKGSSTTGRRLYSLGDSDSSSRRGT